MPHGSGKLPGLFAGQGFAAESADVISVLTRRFLCSIHALIRAYNLQGAGDEIQPVIIDFSYSPDAVHRLCLSCEDSG